MTWDLVTARNGQTVTGKGLINYCEVEWIRGGGTACTVVVIVDVLTGYLSMYPAI